MMFYTGFIGISLAFLVFRYALRLPLACSHSATLYAVGSGRGLNLYKYFDSVNAPLAGFIAHNTYKYGKVFGDLYYWITLIGTGFFMSLFVRLLGFSDGIALIFYVLYIFIIQLPHTYDHLLQPEAYGNFFSAAGLFVTAYGLSTNSSVTIIFGGLISSLGIWSKITSFEAMFSVAYTLYIKGLAPETAYNAIGLASGLIIFVVMVKMRSSARKQETPSFNNKEHIVFDIKRQFGSFFILLKQNTLNLMSFILYFHIILITFVLSIYDGSKYTELVLLFLAVSLLHPLVRLKFIPLYTVLGSSALAIGSSAYIYKLYESNSVFFYVVIADIFIMFISSVIFSHRNKVLKHYCELLPYLQEVRESVAPEDYIFQTSWHPEVYFEVGGKHPHFLYLWGHRVLKSLTSSPQNTYILDYIKDCKPKFIFMFKRALYNIGEIERLTGYQYELVTFGYVIIYKRTNEKNCNNQSADILSPDTERIAKDICAHHSAEIDDKYDKSLFINVFGVDVKESELKSFLEN